MERNGKHALVTGGAGYIGSHTCVELINAGYAVTILDDLRNSSIVAVERIKKLVSRPEDVHFIKGDVTDRSVVHAAMSSARIDCVMHFAALKAVGESVRKPLEYFKVNVGGLLNVLDVMREFPARTFLFSSSATVYGSGEPPFTEESPTGLGIPSPYGHTKYTSEQILKDFRLAYPDFKVIVLRYFNPVGAHQSGIMGEDPLGIPNNLMPFIEKVMTGRLEKLTVYGGDYPTSDGTPERDYVHVADLATGHVKALLWAESHEIKDIEAFNLGTGTKHSVLDVIRAYERVTGKPLPYTIGPRRFGDVPAAWADCDKAERVLGWKASYSLYEMCEDSWRWISHNPAGYNPA